MKSTKPRRQRVARTPTVGRFAVRVGSPNEPGAIKTFTSESLARRAITAALTEFEPWCRRYHREGVKRIKDACNVAAATPFGEEPQRVCVKFDDHYDQTIVVTFWRTP